MIPPLLALPTFIISIAMLARLGLILTGVHKGPLLHLFEKYGDPENEFHMALHILVWTGVILVCIGTTVEEVLHLPTGVTIIGVVLIATGFYVTRLPDSVRGLRVVPALPGWYHHLYNITSREERRQIAYMWLKLPLRLRLLYNVHDHAFFHWVDMVIVATVS